MLARDALLAAIVEARRARVSTADMERLAVKSAWACAVRMAFRPAPLCLARGACLGEACRLATHGQADMPG